MTGLTIEPGEPLDLPHRRSEGLLLRWLLALGVGELLGFLPPALAGALLVSLDAPDPILVVGLTVAGVLEGATIGMAQAWALATRWEDIDGRAWTTATAIAAGLSWFVGMGGSALAGWDRFPLWLAISLLVPGAIVGLLSMGYLQWRVLRRVVGGSLVWVPATALAWLVGVLVPVLVLSAVPDSWPAEAHVAAAVPAAVGMGLVVAAITGRTLLGLAAGPAGPAPAPMTPDPGSLDVRVEAVERRVVLGGLFAWTAVSCFAVESVIVGLSALPAVLFFRWHLGWDFGPELLRVAVLAASLMPAYALFALLFMLLSAVATRVLGWRPPERADLRIADLPPGLRNWARYAIMGHLVRVMAGTMFRSTPIWIWYLRCNGARIGRHVWVNSLQVGDDCLLDLGDEVVIGAGVHLSGHTVERGLVRLAPVTLGAGTTVGVGAQVGIGVVTGEGTHIGSMSVVPKHAVLDAHRTYAGIPVRPIDGDEWSEEAPDR
jgi:acetyltransferase-like isoleucine patch superfamily enzyme